MCKLQIYLLLFVFIIENSYISKSSVSDNYGFIFTKELKDEDIWIYDIIIENPNGTIIQFVKGKPSRTPGSGNKGNNSSNAGNGRTNARGDNSKAQANKNKNKNQPKVRKRQRVDNSRVYRVHGFCKKNKAACGMSKKRIIRTNEEKRLIAIELIEAINRYRTNNE